MFRRYTLLILIFVLLPVTGRVLFAAPDGEAVPDAKEESRGNINDNVLKSNKLDDDYLFRVKKSNDAGLKTARREYFFREFKSLSAGISRTDNAYNGNFNQLTSSFNSGHNKSQKLTTRQIEEKKLEAGFYLATATAELMDSVYLPYFSRGLFNIIGTVYKIRTYRKKIEKKYGIHVELSKNEAFFTYEGNF